MAIATDRDVQTDPDHPPMPTRSDPVAARASAPKLVFVVTEDWFFASHFLPMVEAAQEAGFDVVVITRVRADRAKIEAAGARVIALEADRKSVNPLSVFDNIRRLRATLAHEKPTVLHCIALRSILVGGLAGTLAGVRHRVYAVTGMGFLAAWKGLRGQCAMRAITIVVRGLLENKSTHYLFENNDDPRMFGLDPTSDNVTIVGGAGIDPDLMVPAELPFFPPLKLALVARMLWSKGVDIAVEAVTLARAEGADVTLTLVGAPDPANPRTISTGILQTWAGRPGIVWAGHSRDIAGVWAQHHAAIMPSRGGEGLPRAMLEAAACGRAVLTTDVAGCRSFIRDGIDGFVVPPDQPRALADAILRLQRNPALLETMGRSIRTRLLDGFTIDDVRGNVTQVYLRLLGRNG